MTTVIPQGEVGCLALRVTDEYVEAGGYRFRANDVGLALITLSDMLPSAIAATWRNNDQPSTFTDSTASQVARMAANLANRLTNPSAFMPGQIVYEPIG